MYMNTWVFEQSHQDFKDIHAATRCWQLWLLPLINISETANVSATRPSGLSVSFILLQERDTFILILQKMKRLSRPAISCCFDRRNFKSNEYYGKDKTEVYWIHFTGSNIKNLLRRYGFADKKRIFPVGTSPEYERLFKRIILELQKCQEEYEETLVHLLQLLLIEFERELTKEHVLKDEYMDREMEVAISYFMFLIQSGD